MKQSEKIAEDIRRLKRKRNATNNAIESLEALCVEALLIEAGYPKKARIEILAIYGRLEETTSEGEGPHE